MRITSCSVPKFKRGAGEGDDVLLVLPGCAYAVFDGATDSTGARVAGTTTGRFAATMAAQAAARHLLASSAGHGSMDDWAAGLTAAMNTAIATGLAQAGAPGLRASSTVALAWQAGASWRFLIVGDSGIRLNGTALFRYTKDVDTLYTAGRCATFHRLQARGLEGDVLEATARQLVFRGLGRAAEHGLTAEDVGQILATARQACTGRLQPDAMADLDAMLIAGIGGGQYPHCNRTGHSLGYAALDGTVTRGPDLVSFQRPRSEVRSIELFTDGYFACPAGTRADDWEAASARVETEDFHKTGAYAGVKGSSSTYYTDDRTVLCLEALQD